LSKKKEQPSTGRRTPAGVIQQLRMIADWKGGLFVLDQEMGERKSSRTK